MRNYIPGKPLTWDEAMNGSVDLFPER